MATQLLDSGEAYLPPEEKCYVRGVTSAPPILRSEGFHIPRAVSVLAMSVGIVALTVAALAV